MTPHAEEAQQAVEKALKAVMCVKGLTLRRTHDLEELAAQLEDIGVVAPCQVDELRRLTPYAVSIRYDIDAPAAWITPDDALRVVDTVIAWARAVASE